MFVDAHHFKETKKWQNVEKLICNDNFWEPQLMTWMMSMMTVRFLSWIGPKNFSTRFIKVMLLHSIKSPSPSWPRRTSSTFNNSATCQQNEWWLNTIKMLPRVCLHLYVWPQESMSLHAGNQDLWIAFHVSHETTWMMHKNPMTGRIKKKKNYCFQSFCCLLLCAVRESQRGNLIIFTVRIEKELYLHNELAQLGEVFLFKFRVAHPQFSRVWIQPYIKKGVVRKYNSTKLITLFYNIFK